MIDPTFLFLTIGFALAITGLGTVRREPVLVLGSAVIFILSGLLTVSDGIGNVIKINVSIADAAGNISQWSNSSTSFQVQSSMSHMLGMVLMLSGLFLILSEALRGFGK